MSILKTVACDENLSGDQHPRVAFSAVRGTTYSIQFGIFQNDGTIGFKFEPASTITGLVRASSHRPIPGICADVYDVNNPPVPGTYTAIASTTTDRRGSYTFGDLVDGSYRVHYQDCNQSPTYAPQWYRGRLSFSAADPVVVPFGSVVHADVTLAKGGSITGTIRDSSSGQPLMDVCAEAYDNTDTLEASTLSDSQGAYKLTPLAQTGFKVKFSYCATSSDIHFTQWFNNKADFASATVVPVIAGSTSSGINASLVPATGSGSISGVVTNLKNEPIPTVCVSAFEPGEVEVAGAITGSDGSYNISGLGTGTFKVEFQACASSPYGATQWYDNKPDFDTATPIAVTDGFDTPGIDASLDVPWSGTSHITGTITGSFGSPIQGICVTAYVSADQSVGGDFSRSDGTYHIDGLGTDTFKLQFTDCSGLGYQTQWYNGKADFSSGDPISVTDGIDTTGIDVTMTM